MTFAGVMLWLNAKGSKSESNSQPTLFGFFIDTGCGSMPKVVNLKAIHNILLDLQVTHQLWLNAKGSKSESNSQPIIAFVCGWCVVAQCQR